MKDIDSLIVKYLDNEAADEEKAMLDEWINFSQDNKHYFNRMVKAWEQSRIYLQDEGSAGKRFLRFRQLLHQGRLRRIAYGSSAAAAVALIVLAIRFFVPSPVVVLLSEAAFDQKKEVVMPDGSVVWLNKNSRIQYPEDFVSHRKVYLTGEAYFDVTENRGRPFVVETSDLTVRVLGTRFVVTDYNDEEVAEAVLESGKIQLVTQKTGEAFLLHPGQMASHNRTLGETRLESVDARHFTDWIKNRLVFENTDLKDVFMQLEKWYGIKIKCADAAFLQTPVSLTVDVETKEEILNTLQMVVPFIWRPEPNHGERSPTVTVLPALPH